MDAAEDFWSNTPIRLTYQAFNHTHPHAATSAHQPVLGACVLLAMQAVSVYGLKADTANKLHATAIVSGPHRRQPPGSCMGRQARGQMRAAHLLLGLERGEEGGDGGARLGRVVRRRHQHHARRPVRHLHQLLHVRRHTSGFKDAGPAQTWAGAAQPLGSNFNLGAGASEHGMAQHGRHTARPPETGPVSNSLKGWILRQAAWTRQPSGALLLPVKCAAPVPGASIKVHRLVQVLRLLGVCEGSGGLDRQQGLRRAWGSADSRSSISVATPALVMPRASVWLRRSLKP